MATKAKRHVHKYHRVTLSFGEVWACALPDCNHYMPQHMAGIVEGKYSICWECSENFTLDKDAMVEKQPRCAACRYPELNEIAKALESKVG